MERIAGLVYIVKRSLHNRRVQEQAEAEALIATLPGSSIALLRLMLPIHFGAAMGIEFRLREIEHERGIIIHTKTRQKHQRRHTETISLAVVEKWLEAWDAPSR